MKQGSADDPFADEDEDKDDADVTGDDTAASDTLESPISADSARTSEDIGTHTEQHRSLPYIHSRDGVKDGRTQRPVFLRDHVESGIDDLVDQMESEFGTDVYKTDVTEAAMAVAQEHPDLVYEKLDEWGYGWD